jgi:autotransporter-associated beta strand protein
MMTNPHLPLRRSGRISRLLFAAIPAVFVGSGLVHADFSGPFASGNFTLSNNNAAGSVNTSLAPASVAITGGDAGGFTGAGNTSYSLLAPAGGRVQFVWSFTTADSSANWDPFGYVIAGSFTQLTDNGLSGQSGVASFGIASGQSMGFQANTLDNGGGASTTTVSNLLFSDTLYWKGNTNGTWTGANWTLDAGGANPTAAPDANVGVIFSATGATNKTTTLGQDFTIQRLTISDPAAVIINGANTLTTTGPAGTGLDVQSAAGLFTSNANLTLGGSSNLVTVNNAAGAVINGAVGGSNGLTKTGTGNLTLNAASNYTGGTTIYGNGPVPGGTLTAGVPFAIPSGTALTIGRLSTFSDARFNTGGFPHTISSLTIYGLNSGNYPPVVDVGTGTLTLNGNISFLDAANAPGNARGGKIAAAPGGTLNLGGAVRDVVLAGQGGGGISTTNPGALGIYAVVANGGINFTGNPSSTGQGPTGMTLGASTANTYGLGTTVNAGTLNVAATTTLGAATGALTLNTSGTVASNVILNSSQTVGSLQTGTLGTAAATITLNGAGTQLTVNQASNTAHAGVFSGAGSLRKQGTGQLTLSGANNYSGITNIDAGTVQADSNGALGSTAAGTVVASGATLALGGSLTIDAGEGLTLAGTGVGGNGALRRASGSPIYNGPITLAADTRVSPNFGTLTLGGTIDLAGNVLTMSLGANTGAVNLNGVISGTGSFLIRNGGTGGGVSLNAANTYQGTTSIGAGNGVTGGTLLFANVPNALPTTNGRTPVVISAGGVGNSGRLNIAGASQAIASLVGDPAGQVILGANNLTIGFGSGVNTNGTANADFIGVISGNGGVVKDNTSPQVFSGPNAYSGGTVINGGVLIANETIAGGGSATGTGPVTVNSTATLTGGSTNGTIGSVRGALQVNSGGAVVPGNAGTGVLTVNGNATFASGSTLQVEINGATAGTGHDQLLVNGTVNLGGSTLSLSGGFVATIGNEIKIVSNDGTEPVTGTFAGLPEASPISFNGAPVVITYAGGDGNDVVLLVPDPTVRSFAGTGSGSLRQAIALVPSGTTIDFDPALGSGTILLGGTELLINKNLTIDASTASGAIKIDAQGNSRVFEVAVGADVTMDTLTITGGDSGFRGGGIHNLGSVDLKNATISGNIAAQNGGGIYSSGTLSVTNCTVANNQTESFYIGAGIYCDSGSVLTVSASTISKNSTNTGVGGGIRLNGTNATIRNSIIAHNSGAGQPDLARVNGGSLTPGGFNLIGDNATVTTEFPADGILVGTTASPVDPLLAPLGSYGGPTQTMALLHGSPAIDAAGTSSPADQRGFPRGDDGDGDGSDGPDIGAFEVGVTIVTSAANSGPGSLRDTLNLPNTGRAIRFDPLVFTGSPTTINLTTGSGPLVIPASVVSVDASQIPAGVTINAGNTRVLQSDSPSTIATLEGITLTGGSSTSGGNGSVAGGVWNSSTLTLIDCSVTGNVANTIAGGILNSGSGILTLRGCTLSGNTAYTGSGGGIYNSGSLIIDDSTLAGNITSSSDGGGIWSSGTVTLNRTTVAGNSARGGGGIHAVNDSVTTISDCTFSGNTASESSTGGGGIRAVGSDLFVSNSTFYSNSANHGGGIQFFNTAVTKTFSLRNSTLSGNTGTSSGGGLEYSATIGTNEIRNNIVADNTSAVGPDLYKALAGPLTPTGPNLVGNNSTVATNFPVGPLVGTSGSPLDPLLAPLADYGGPTQTMALLPGSPALDAGDAGALPNDQRGVARGADGDGNGSGAPDLGAFELQEILVTSTMNNGMNSLRAAIDSEFSASVIRFSPTNFNGNPTTITLGSQLDISNKLIWIDASTLPSGVTLSGGGATRVLNITGNSLVTLDNLTVTGGSADSGGGIYNTATLTLNDATISNNSVADITDGVTGGSGGGIYNSGTLTLNDATISNNSAIEFSRGGGIYNTGGTLTVNQSKLSGNFGEFDGGAIYNTGGSVTVNDSEFSDNTTPGSGGGIYSTLSGTVTVNNTTLSGNSANFGGGIYNLSSSVLAIHDSSLVGNSASNDGGGIRNLFSTVTITNTTLSGNSSEVDGGGIANGGNGTVDLDKVTLSGNSADSNGGGIRSDSGVVTLVNVTLSGNAADSAGGGISLSSGTLNIDNTIVAANSAPAGPELSKGSGTIIPSGGNLIGNNDSVASEFPIGVLVGDSISPLDPLLSPLGNYGGPTQTMHPLVGSPAIDAGAPTALGTDQRGFARDVDGTTPGGAGSSVLDIGAVEAGVVRLVTNSLSSTAAGSLRAALLAASSSQADRILFNLPSETTITLSSTLGSEFTGKTVFLDASSLVQNNGTPLIEDDGFGNMIVPSGVEVSGNYGYQVFSIASNTTVTLQGLTVANGASSSGGGGGISNNGTLTLNHSKVSGSATSVTGGGIRNTALGVVALNDSTISGNAAIFGSDGGGISNRGILTVTNSTISGNSANSNSGGGVFNQGTAVFTTSTVSGNSANYGGGIYVDSGSLHVESTTISDNTSLTIGGGISSADGNSTIRNSIVAGNTAPTAVDIDASGGPVTGSGTNLIGDNSSVETEFPAGPLVGTAVLPIDPALAPLADNGGPTETMMLLPGSLAIDAGIASGLLPITDQRGFTRVLAGGLDLGAYETSAGSYNLDGLTLHAKLDPDLAAAGVRIEISADPDFLPVVSTFAGMADGIGSNNGPRASSTFSYPTGIARDDAGNIFIADTGNHSIRMLAPDGTVSTIAGTGSFGYLNGLGNVAKFAFPAAVTVDKKDNSTLYVSDTFNHRIRKITRPAVAGLQWTVTTLAGTGPAGFRDGSGSVAKFSHPHGLTTDPAGNVYVADSLNHRIRRVTPTGSVSTFAGSGVAGGSDVSLTGCATTDLNTSVTCSTTTGLIGGMGVSGTGIPSGTTIASITSPTSFVLSTAATATGSGLSLTATSNGPKLAAQFNLPFGLVFDSTGVPSAVAGQPGTGNLYIADRDTHSIRRIALTNNQVTTLAGGSAGFVNDFGPAARFNQPIALAVDTDNDLYVADELNHAIRKVATGTGEVTTVAGLKPATPGEINGNSREASFDCPSGLVFDLSGRLVVADTQNHLLRRIVIDPLEVDASLVGGGVDASGQAVTAFVDATTLGLDPNVTYYVRWRALTTEMQTQMNGPSFFLGEAPIVETLDATDLFTASVRLNAEIDSKGSATNARFRFSTDPDLLNPVPVVVTSSPVPTAGGSVLVLANVTSGLSQAQTYYFQAEATNGRGTVVGETLSFTVPVTGVVTLPAAAITKTSAQLNGMVDPLGSSTEVTFEYSTDPNLSGPLGVSTFAPTTGTNPASDLRRGVVVNSSGIVYFSDRLNHKIRKITPGTPAVVSDFVGTGTPGDADGNGTTAQFDHPAGLAIDADNNIYVADELNQVIRVITPAGAVTTIAGSGVAGSANNANPLLGQFLFPSGLAVNSAGTTLYVADRGNHRIRLVSLPGGPLAPGGSLSTFAGGSTAGFADGPATSARFTHPADVALDSDGNLYVADEGNHAIRSLDPTGQVLTIAGMGETGFAEGTGVAAKFSSPSSIAIDAADLLYVADRGNHRIRTVTTAGETGTLAGSGVAGLLNSPLPDELVPTTAAEFDRPSALAFDPTTPLGGPPTLFVVDAGNAVMREISPSTVRTLTATQSPLVGNAPDSSVDATATMLWPGSTYYFRAVATNPGGTIKGAILSFTTLTNQAIEVFDGPDAESDELTDAQTSEIDFGVTPFEVAVKRSFTIANTGEVPLSISSITVSPATGYDVTEIPSAVAAGGTETFMITLNGSSTGIFDALVTIASDDPDTARASFTFPITGEVLDPPAVTTVAASNVEATSATLNAEVNPNGTSTTVWFEYSTDPNLDGVNVSLAAGSTPGYQEGTGAAAKFDEPRGVATDATGNIYVADTKNHRIRRIAPNGSSITFAGDGTPGFVNGAGSSARFNEPVGIVIAVDGTLFVTDSKNHCIRAIATDGTVTTHSGLGTAGFTEGVGTGARFNQPWGLAIDLTDTLYVADKGNHRVRIVATDGSVSTLAGNGTTAVLNSPIGIAVSSTGLVLITEGGSHLVRRIQQPGGAIDTFAGSTPGFLDAVGTSARFSSPQALAFDITGRLLVADSGNHRIRRIATNGAVDTVAGTGTPGTTPGLDDVAQFDAPISIVVADNGDPIVGELTNGTIRRIVSTNVLVQATTGLNGTSPTPVSLPVAGVMASTVYHFRAVASNSGGTTLGAILTIETSSGTVITKPPFETWQLLNFEGDANDPLIAGPDADPSGDGVSNRLKYAFGLDPNLNSRAGLPFVGQSPGQLTLTYNEVLEATDLTYTVQWSTNLIDWYDTDISKQNGTNDGITQTIVASIARGTDPRKFMRLGLTLEKP